MTDRTSPLFSIITVTLNNIAGLKETHRSLKLQTFRDFEWIVMDGGSNDASADYLKTTDAQWHSEKDEGLYDAMNEGIARAKGDYLLFLNAGDMFADAGILEEIAKHAEKKPDFIYGDALETQGGTNPPFYKKAFSVKELPRGMFTHHQAMLYARRIVCLNQLHYSLLYGVASDYDFTARFLRYCKKVAYLPRPVCIFQSGGLSQQQAYVGRREQYLIREKLELCSQFRNFWIFVRQWLAWRIRAMLPWVYRASKKPEKHGKTF